MPTDKLKVLVSMLPPGFYYKEKSTDMWKM